MGPSPRMTKNILVWVIIIVFVGGGVWLFVRKSSKVSEVVLTSPSPTSTPMPTVNQLVEITPGLQAQDLIVGSGPTAVSGQIIAVNYIGTLINGTKFDSSYDRGQPFQFILGAGQVIKGWDIGVAGMKVGGKRRLVISPELAYGARAMGPIPANSILLFDVELLAVQTPTKK